MLSVILRAAFGGDISSETARILAVYACPLDDDLKVALRRPPAWPSLTVHLQVLGCAPCLFQRLVCAVICAGSQCLTQLKCGVFENNSMHGQGGGVLYSHDTHTAWKADQITCKHFISCIGYTKIGRSAPSQVKVWDARGLLCYISPPTRTLLYTNKGTNIPAHTLAPLSIKKVNFKLRWRSKALEPDCYKHLGTNAS